MPIETSVVFEEKVGLTARDFGNPKINIQKMILAKLAQKLEGKCSVHGWVRPKTLRILSRSMGYVEKGRFTGDIVFHVQAEGKVFNPPSGVEVVGVVSGNNKMGMYVNVEDAIKVILPRDLHIGEEYADFHNTQIGDKVRVEIKKSRFQVNDEFILSVGLYLGKVGSDYVPPVRETVEDIYSEEPIFEEDTSKFMEQYQQAQQAQMAAKQKRLEDLKKFLTTGEVSKETIQQPTTTAATTEPPVEYNEFGNIKQRKTKESNLINIYDLPPLEPITKPSIGRSTMENID